MALPKKYFSLGSPAVIAALGIALDLFHIRRFRRR